MPLSLQFKSAPEIDQQYLPRIHHLRMIAGAGCFLLFLVFAYLCPVPLQIIPISAICLFLILVNPAYDFLLKHFNRQKVTFAEQVIDVLAITSAMYFLGGGDIFPLLLCYPLVFLATALTLEPGKTYVIANLSALGYAALLFIEQYKILPNYPTNLQQDLDYFSRLELILLVTAIFNLLSYYINFVVKMARNREESLARSRKLFNNVAQHTREWIWQTDCDGRFVHCSSVVQNLLGYTLEEMRGKFFYSFVPAEHQEAVQESLEDHFMIRETLERVLIPILKKDGSRCVVEVSALPLRDDKGMWIGYGGLSRDVTDSINMQSSVREAQARAETIYRVVPSAIFTVDKERRITSWNKQAESITGYSEEEVLGQTCSVFVISPCGAHCGLYDEFTAKPIFGRECKILTKDGQEKNVLKNADFLRDAGGNIIGGIESFEDITEHKKAGAKLQEAHQNLLEQHSVFLQGSVVIFKWKAEEGWPVEYVSGNVGDVLGYSAEEFLSGKVKYTDIVFPQDIERVTQEVRQAMSSWKAQFIHEDYRVVRKNGEVVWLQDFTTIARDASGRVLHFLGYVIDITRRKIVEQQLEAYKLNLEQLVQDRTHSLEESNRQLALEIQERTKTQNALDASLRYEKGLAAFSQNLLRLKSEEIQIALRSLLSASGAGRVYVFENFNDPDRGVCCRQAYEVCAPGVAAELNNPFLQDLPYSPVFKRWEEELSAKKAIAGIVSNLPEAEREFLLKQSIKSILVLPIFVSGQWYGFIGFDDTSVEREWVPEEITLLQTAAEIFAIYLEREAANRSLQQAKERAEMANRFKTEFVFNVSHEMRTPLHCVMGFAETISHARDLNTAHEMAEVILTESDFLMKLINDILDQAKIEEGKMLLDPRPTDLMALVESVRQNFIPTMKNKGLEFRCSLQADIPRYVVVDALRLRQVLLNLINNAIKFTDHGSVKLKVTLSGEQGDTAVIRFAVVDTGIGIPQDKQDLVFQRFIQIDGTAKRRYGGTGLGTTIAKSLVEMMGGQIGLNSQEGSGSEFWFYLPLPLVRDASVIEKLKTEVAAPSGSPNAIVKDLTGMESILVVEDYAPNQALVKMHLENAGYSVTAVSDGRAAIEICRQKLFDLIIMDVQMPGMDGMEATREIRGGSPLCQNTPIMGLTANADPLTRENCLKVGMNDIVTKPIRRDPFLTAVKQLLHASQPLPADAVQNETREFALDNAAANAIVLDYAAALNEFGGNRDLLQVSLWQLLQSVEKKLPELREAVSRRDRDFIRKEMHKIRGAAANLTAMRLSVCARELEEQGEAEPDSRSVELFAEFEKEFARFTQYVRTL